MKRLNMFVVIFIIVLQVMFSNAKGFACMGTPCPDCCRTVWVAKFTPSVVLFPGTGVPITVPVSLVPFASWITAQNLNCTSPTSASVTITLTCTSAGGVVTTIGPVTTTVAPPTAPGVQPLITLPFTIPAGTFAALTPQICTVVGTYTVDFPDASISGTGDTVVCLVPPSPEDPSIPELNMERVVINNEDFITCKKGDQGTIFYTIENNRRESVTLNFTAKTNQVGKMPTSSVPNDPTLFAISDPNDDTDNFPISISGSGNPGELIDLPDPLNNDRDEVSGTITIPSMGVHVIAIDFRSWGMCANGSCSEKTIKLEGTFAGGDPALACAGTAIVVGDAPAKSALCDVDDSVKSSPNANVDWSIAEFGDENGLFIASSTFFNGQTTSQSLVNLPPQASETIRTDIPATTVRWGANSSVNFPEANIFAQNAFMAINATGLTPDLPCAVPLIGFGQGAESNLQIDYNMGADSLTIFDMSNTVTLDKDIFVDEDGDGNPDPNGVSFPEGEKFSLGQIEGDFVIIDPEDGCDCTHLHGVIFIDGVGPFFDPNQRGCGFGCVEASTSGGSEVFAGSFSGFINGPPTGFQIDHDTCRTINITCPPGPADQPVLTVNPRTFAAILNNNDPRSFKFEVLNSRNQQNVSWNASGSETGIALESLFGGPGTDLTVDVDPSQILPFPATTIALIEVTNGSAVGDMFLPVILRSTGIESEICDNGIDDDGDGNVDCEDDDCRDDPTCGVPTLKSLTADPSEIDTFRFTRVTIKAVDNSGNDMEGVIIEATAGEGPATRVFPASASTDNEGNAVFRVRFGFRADETSSVEFVSSSVSTTIKNSN